MGVTEGFRRCNGATHDPVAMYATPSPGFAFPAPAYLAVAWQPPFPAQMYLTTVSSVVGPSGMFYPMSELLDGGGGDFSGFLQALAELGWSGVTISNVLSALPQVYRLYREGHNHADEAVRWCAEYYILRDEQSCQTVGASGV